MTRLYGIVEKAWGYEDIFITTDDYCGKKMVFTKKGAKFSMHFHKEKRETWLILSGKFQLEVIDTTDASRKVIMLEEGEVHTNEPMVPHQLTCIEEGTILEISTPDSVEDNYRVLPGDSQNIAY